MRITRKRWTKEELQLLKEHYPYNKTIETVKKFLEEGYIRTQRAIENMASKKGFNKIYPNKDKRKFLSRLRFSRQYE